MGLDILLQALFGTHKFGKNSTSSISHEKYMIQGKNPDTCFHETLRKNLSKNCLEYQSVERYLFIYHSIYMPQ
jgi:hypothetical protein